MSGLQQHNILMHSIFFIGSSFARTTHSPKYKRVAVAASSSVPLNQMIRECSLESTPLLVAHYRRINGGRDADIAVKIIFCRSKVSL